MFPALQRGKLIDSRDIEANGFKWYMADTVIPSFEPCILNTDVMDGPGQHWLCVVQTSKNSCYIYDPLGKSNKRVTSDGQNAEAIIRERLREYGISRIVYYQYESQRVTSSYCGWFALFVAKLIRDNHLKTPRQITDAIYQCFGKSADVGDEKKISQAFD